MSRRKFSILSGVSAVKNLFTLSLRILIAVRKRSFSHFFLQIYLRETANAIVSEQSPKRLLEVRQRLYELLTKCIPPDVIMKVSEGQAFRSIVTLFV